MTHEQPHHEHAQDAFIDALFEESPVNIAALLRACADGELTPEQCERLEALLSERPESQSQHDFEEQLRACCKRSMAKPCCPEALRAKVGAIAGAYETQEQQADRIERVSDATRQPSFWSRAPMMGVAAALMLGTAGVLIWQSASLLGTSPSGGMGVVSPVSYTEHVGRFAMGEHVRCAVQADADQKLTHRDIAQAVAHFSEQFQRPVATPDMSALSTSISFYGGGACNVPMTATSGHLRFDARDVDGNPISLSLFIAPDPGQLDLEEGVTYHARSQACSEAGASLFIWVREGVQYVLVSEATHETCALVRSALHAPDKLGSI